MSINEKQKNNIELIINEVRSFFASDFSGHDFQHTMRVLDNAVKIQSAEGGELYIIMLSSLLHDVDDKKISPSTAKNKENAERILRLTGADDVLINEVKRIISTVSFSEGEKPLTTEGKIVQDADRLDAIGAIGIARCFAFGGNKKRPIYCDADFTADKNENCNSGVAHFYSKLLKLNGLMQTETGRKIAEDRTEFMKEFLQQLKNEINVNEIQ